MKTYDPDPATGSTRSNAISLLVLGGALILTGGGTGCQKKGTDAVMNAGSDGSAVELMEPAAEPTPAPPADSLTPPAVEVREEVTPGTAETDLRAELKAHPGNDRARFKLARVYLDELRPVDALKLVETMNESAEAMRLTGRAYHQQGRADEALAAYRKALSLNDQDAWSMNNMALIYIEKGNFTEALPPLARAIELRTGVAVFHNNLGVALERGGSYEAAAEAYTSAVRIDAAYGRAELSRQRVLTLTSAGQPAPDLAGLADRFEEAIAAWRNTELAGGAADPR